MSLFLVSFNYLKRSVSFLASWQLRVCLVSGYFVETEIFLLKIL